MINTPEYNHNLHAMRKIELNAHLPKTGSRYTRLYSVEEMEAIRETARAKMVQLIRDGHIPVIRIPDLFTVADIEATKSVSLYVQMVGRATPRRDPEWLKRQRRFHLRRRIANCLAVAGACLALSAMIFYAAAA